MLSRSARMPRFGTLPISCSRTESVPSQSLASVANFWGLSARETSCGAEAGTKRRYSWWLKALTSNEGLAAEYVRSHARKVTDIMTRHVVTAKPDTAIGEIASLLEKNGIKRVPIVQDGKVVGI